jgi:general stress protein CsbA
MGSKRWQDWVNIVLGAWLVASPWLFGYTTEPMYAAWAAYGFGLAVILFAAIAVYMPKAWEEWVTVLLGLALIASPWVLGFAGHLAATLNAVVLGMLVVFFAASAMSLDKQIDKWWHA